MISENKKSANANNAKLSSGPRSIHGKRRSSRNALRHGLAVAVGSDPGCLDNVEVLARIICLTSGDQKITDRSRAAAEAAIDVLRIRKVRTSVLNAFYQRRGTTDYYSGLDDALTKLDRYERRALSLRNRAFKLVGVCNTSR